MAAPSPSSSRPHVTQSPKPSDGRQSEPLTRSLPEEQERCQLLEQIYVHDVYERMAADFQTKQCQPWPVVTEFLTNLDVGSLVADVGCGNGHYMKVNPSISLIGLDRCSQLLELAQQQNSGLSCRGDCLALPYRDSSFDAALCVGVIHHLVSYERQTLALTEMCRILKPGGQLLLCAWAWEQPKRKFVGQNLLVPRHTDKSTTIPTCCGSQNKVTKPAIDKSSNEGQQISESLLAKLENMLIGGPKSLLKRFSANRDAKGSDSGFSDTSSVSSVQSADSSDMVICDLPECSDDYIEIPEEFQVREFPASSLFAISKANDQKPTPGPLNHSDRSAQNRKKCRHHVCTQSRLKGRDERFYHVFKSGELSSLISNHVPSLTIQSCVYNSGHWCILARKSYDSNDNG